VTCTAAIADIAIRNTKPGRIGDVGEEDAAVVLSTSSAMQPIVTTITTTDGGEGFPACTPIKSQTKKQQPEEERVEENSHLQQQQEKDKKGCFPPVVGDEPPIASDQNLRLVQEAIQSLGGRATCSEITDWMFDRLKQSGVTRKKLSQAANAVISAKKFRPHFEKVQYPFGNMMRNAWKLSGTSATSTTTARNITSNANTKKGKGKNKDGTHSGTTSPVPFDQQGDGNNAGGESDINDSDDSNASDDHDDNDAGECEDDKASDAPEE